jgi:hypothetical protein
LSSVRSKIAVAIAVAAVALAALALPVAAKMKSTKVEAGLCLTEGGGRFVDIPGFTGERIDRRLLRDVKYLKRHYKIFVTDGFSEDPVHSANGEHPIGLALDIVPDKARGGTWADIDALAAWAEPKQNQPIQPFRWVGYDGDAGHGRGHHLHLSWSHSESKFGKPADSVYTLRCPKKGPKRSEGSAGGGGNGGEEKPDKPDKPDPPSGGTEPGDATPSGPSGGTTPKLAPVVAERGGIDG